MGIYDNTIIDYANQNNVDPSLALAVAQAESGGQQYDANGNVLTSSAGAQGVMQLEPGTAAAYGSDATNPTENIDAGTAYLGDLINQYGDEGTALAAYNWGPGNVNRAIAAYGTTPAAFGSNIVPAWFLHAPSETQNYVIGIMGARAFGGGSLPSSIAPLPLGSPSTVASALQLTSNALPALSFPASVPTAPGAAAPAAPALSSWVLIAAALGFGAVLLYEAES